MQQTNPPSFDQDGQPVPLPYRWLIAHHLIHFKPWHLIVNINLSADEPSRVAFNKESGFRRDVVTFARRQDNDDIAGFEVINAHITERVIAFHPSYTNRPNPGLIDAEFADLWDFLRQVVVKDMKDWADEAELEDMKHDGGPAAA